MTIWDATIHYLRPPAPVNRGCLVKDCHDEARWALRMTCNVCGERGGGPTCDFHRLQAVEWGVPHPGCEQLAPVTFSAPLGAR